MKGRGTRTIDLDSLRKVTPTAKTTKDHFVIIDAIGVTRSLKTDSRPLEKKPGIPLKDLLKAVAVGARDEELFTTLASRLTRLDRQITEKERALIEKKALGKSIPQIAKELLSAFNPDILEEIENKIRNEKADSTAEEIETAIILEKEKLQNEAARVFTGELNEYIENVRKDHEQRIDLTSPDEVINVGWDNENKEKVNKLIIGFTEWIEQNKDKLTALQIFYDQPFRRRELTYKMIKEVLEKLKHDKPSFTTLNIWNAYASAPLSNLASAGGLSSHASTNRDLSTKTNRALSGVEAPKNELTALVSLIRKVCGIDSTLTAYDKTVDKNFQDWVWKRHSGAGEKFTEEQMEWLRMIKEYVVNSFHIEKEDFDLNPFNAQGGLGKMWQLFGEKTEQIINELNEALAA